MNNIGWFLFFSISTGPHVLLVFLSVTRFNFLANGSVTHNPVNDDFGISIPFLSSATSTICLSLSLPTVLLAFTMYFPSLIWEVCRKIRAKDETEYVILFYAFGYKKSPLVYRGGDLLDILTISPPLWNISHVGV